MKCKRWHFLVCCSPYIQSHSESGFTEVCKKFIQLFYKRLHK